MITNCTVDGYMYNTVQVDDLVWDEDFHKVEGRFEEAFFHAHVNVAKPDHPAEKRAGAAPGLCVSARPGGQ